MAGEFTPEDGGPAFPRDHVHDGHNGMSQRALFAAILMHGELVSFAAPGEYRNALIDEVGAGDVNDLMASNAVAGADALLSALAEPREPDPIQAHLTYNAFTTPASEHAAIRRLAAQHDFGNLPEFIRDFVTLAVAAIENVDDVPF